jgi:lysophospholipase L1-like esterase
MKSILHKFGMAGLLLLAACKPEIKTPTLTKGSADFSTYIAIGDSQTAGYADNGLYLDGQKNSFPSIIAQQLKAVGGGDFNQPLFSDAQADGSGYIQLTGFSATGSPVTTTVANHTAIRGTQTIPSFGNVTLYTKYTGNNNNYGIPGIKLSQITYAPYGNLNGYFERLLPGNSPTNTTTYLDFATAKPYTFFTCWLGNNDALGYATAGGASDALTDKTQFTQLYTALINKLTANGQKGVVATIPDVTSIPYFTTVKVSAIQASLPAGVSLLISAKNDAGGYATRVATSDDLLVLTTPAALIGKPQSGTGYIYGLDPRAPIENQYVLDKNEIALVRDYVASYNATITSIAETKGLAVFDAYTFLNTVNQKGLVVNGVNLSSAYISGGLFSLDGVHLTPRGYAIEANEFIKAANVKYGATIPQVNISNYAGVKFP